MTVLLRMLLVFCLLAPAAKADPPPRPKPKQSLESLQARMESEQGKKEKIEKEIKAVGNELETSRRTLKKAAAKIRDSEILLQSFEQSIADAEREDREIRDRLGKSSHSMAALITAMQRMRRVPPETMIARPGAPLDTARSAAVLKSVLPVVDRRIVALSADLTRLCELKRQLDSDREKAAAQKRNLEKEYAAIDSLTKERKKQYRKLTGDRSRSEADLERMAREARSMQDLLDRLREAGRERDFPEGAQESRQIAAMPGTGRVRLPVAGVLVTAYGEKDDIGADSEGITVKASSAALAVAPMGGIVRFAGAFKNYGKMIILEHEGGYHSLIAGLDSVSVVTGQGLESGEPVGRLPSASSDGNTPTLYYELRRNGKPVNPSTRFSELRI